MTALRPPLTSAIDQTEGSAAGSVQAVRRALSILRAFKIGDRALSLGEIAGRTRLDKGTTRRLLMTLIGEHLIDQKKENRQSR